MWNFQDLTGRKFGKLVVIERADDYVSPSGNKITRWMCRCDCGGLKVANGSELKRGKIKSCGCIHKESWRNVITKHDLSHTRLYRIWRGIKTRCLNTNNQAYCLYGGDGKTICDEWLKFEPFYEWSMSHGYSDELSIDRKDGTKGYSPDNCRWVDSVVQANNTTRNRYITYNGKTQTMAQWAREMGIPYRRLSSRLNKLNWSVEKALKKR